jgi:hypothetical protein
VYNLPVRTVKVVVLRLLIDPEQPDRLLGAARAVPTTVGQSFSSGEGLLEVLRRLATRAASPEPSPQDSSIPRS